MPLADMRSAREYLAYSTFKSVNAELSAVTGQACSLKPEVSILLDLYEAEREERLLTASSVGLSSGVPQTTTIRYLRLLEERRWITRSRHATDQRVSFVRLTPSIIAALDDVFER